MLAVALITDVPVDSALIFTLHVGLADETVQDGGLLLIIALLVFPELNPTLTPLMLFEPLSVTVAFVLPPILILVEAKAMDKVPATGTGVILNVDCAAVYPFDIALIVVVELLLTLDTAVTMTLQLFCADDRVQEFLLTTARLVFPELMLATMPVTLDEPTREIFAVVDSPAVRLALDKLTDKFPGTALGFTLI